MRANLYQRQTRTTAVYPFAQSGGPIPVTYLSLGLASEAGEVAGKVKKAIRDDHGEVSDERREQIAAEVGDVLWYAARLADELGFNLSEIMENNLEKLLSRRDRGMLGGDGDSR